ncbi:MAG: glutathione S-transferase family protein [Elainellaceae cyanobacterium]
MLTFHYHPLSPIARRVWLALLEKGLDFEPVEVNLKAGENRQPRFSALNPFHHVPVLTDEDLTLIESLAILDYLEAKFPAQPLTPTSPVALAQMRMVQMVTVNELVTQLPRLAADPQPESIPERLSPALGFLASQLAQQNYFGGDGLSLADVVAGAALPLMHRLGVSLDDYPTLDRWRLRLMGRTAWRQTEPSDEAFAQWKRWVGLMVRRQQRTGRPRR